jgi:hypothetical protein
MLLLPQAHIAAANEDRQARIGYCPSSGHGLAVRSVARRANDLPHHFRYGIDGTIVGNQILPQALIHITDSDPLGVGA